MNLILFLLILIAILIGWIWITHWLALRILAGRIAEGGIKTLATGLMMLVISYLTYQAIHQTFFVAWKNPFAKDAVVLRGRFPFDQGWEFSFNQTALTPYTSNICEGLGASLPCVGAKETLKPERIDDRHYRFVAYRDYYFKGVVGWLTDIHIYAGYYLIHTKVNGIDRTPLLELGKTMNIVCSKNTKRHWTNCASTLEHQDYKNLIFTEEQSIAPDEYVMNIWLDSELDLLLKQEKRK